MCATNDSRVIVQDETYTRHKMCMIMHNIFRAQVNWLNNYNQLIKEKVLN